MPAMPPPLPTSQQPPRSSFLLYGCLGLGVLLVVIALIGAAAVFAGFSVARQTVDRFTADRPESLPVVKLTAVEEAQLESKFVEVSRAYRSGEAFELVLNAAELSAALADNTKLDDVLAVEIEGDRLHGHLSLPLDDFGLHGRWLNGEAALGLTATNGVVTLAIDQLRVNEKSIPARVLKRFAGSLNLLEGAIDNGEALEYIAAIESIHVADAQVHIRFKEDK